MGQSSSSQSQVIPGSGPVYFQLFVPEALPLQSSYAAVERLMRGLFFPKQFVHVFPIRQQAQVALRHISA